MEGLGGGETRFYIHSLHLSIPLSLYLSSWREAGDPPYIVL
jgi:hypothetical protein